MKKLILLSILILCGIVAASAQTKVALKGDAYMIKNGDKAALEIGGKIVIPESKGYLDFTASGDFFIAQFMNGSYKLLDNTGNQVRVGGGFFFTKLSIVDGTIVAQIGDDPPKYYSVNDPETEIRVQQAGADFFDQGRQFNPEKMTRDKAAAEAERLSALMPPENRIEIRQRAGLQWQEIVVHGKVVHDAKEYTILNDEEWLKEKGFWVLAAKFNGMYGVIAVEAYTDEETGELISGAIQLIPYEYTWASNHDGTGPMISCTTRSVTRHYFNYTGWQFSLDARTGKYTGMQKRWVYDELTGKWSLQTVADGEVSFARWVPDPATGKLTLKNQ